MKYTDRVMNIVKDALSRMDQVSAAMFQDGKYTPQFCTESE